MHVWIHTHTPLYTYLLIHVHDIFTYMCVYVCMYACMYVFLYTYHTHLLMYVFTYLLAYIYIINVYMYMYVYMCICIYIYAHTQILSYTIPIHTDVHVYVYTGAIAPKPIGIELVMVPNVSNRNVADMGPAMCCFLYIVHLPTCANIYVSACMYVRTYVCMYVCMRVCMHVYRYIDRYRFCTEGSERHHGLKESAQNTDVTNPRFLPCLAKL